jgi:hypothetical protein
MNNRSFSSGIKDVFTAVGIVAGYYALMALVVIMAW